MKRLLAQGYPDIYQICKAFRNGERGRIHNPEFTMLEWYRLGFSMMQLIDEVAALTQLVLGNKNVTKQSYQSLFLKTLQLDPLTATLGQLFDWCKKHDCTIPVNHTTTDILGFLMAQYIEPQLPANSLVFVFDYPIEQAVFAVPSVDDSRVARRFELYYNGIELCNGFEELSDWEENHRRMRLENEKRIAMGKASLPGDHYFIDALKQGIPNCSGVAVGLDRLIMLGAGSQCIEQILTFPWELA